MKFPINDNDRLFGPMLRRTNRLPYLKQYVPGRRDEPNKDPWWIVTSGTYRTELQAPNAKEAKEAAERRLAQIIGWREVEEKHSRWIAEKMKVKKL